MSDVIMPPITMSAALEQSAHRTPEKDAAGELTSVDGGESGLLRGLLELISVLASRVWIDAMVIRTRRACKMIASSQLFWRESGLWVFACMVLRGSGVFWAASWNFSQRSFISARGTPLLNEAAAHPASTPLRPPPLTTWQSGRVAFCSPRNELGEFPRLADCASCGADKY